MRIFLLRHGEAESHASSDSQRKLTAAGRQQVADAARVFAARESFALDCVLVSPYVRAQQTCEIFLGNAFPGRALATKNYEGITPDGSPHECIDYLQETKAERILLVTHQPFVSGLLELLTNASTAQSVSNNPPMLTSSLVCLEADVAAPGCAQLLWFSSPPHQG